MSLNSGKRKKIELRRRQVAELYRKGITNQWEIAERLNVDRSTISLDLKALEKRWKESQLVNLDIAKKQILEELEGLKRTYWETWDKEEKKDPRLLQGILACIEQKCKILGIYQQTDISGLIINISSNKVNLDNC